MSKILNLNDKNPENIAKGFENVFGIAKSQTPNTKLIILGFLAGAYIAFGGLLSISVTFDVAPILGIGIKKIISGTFFCVGLILVVIAGAELFTGNNLMIISKLSNKITWKDILKNWTLVYTANFIGSLFIVIIFYYSGLWKTGNNELGLTSIKIAQTKLNLNFSEALFRGIGCNWLVCLAIWMAYGARTIYSKITAIFFPIMGFVAIGFEHCIANMFFIPSAIFIKKCNNIIPSNLDIEMLNWHTFLFNNLLPVTIGNIIGGSCFVGIAYWYIYIKNSKLTN